MLSKKRIRTWLHSKPILYLMFSIVHRRNDKAYIDFITSADRNSELILMKDIDNMSESVIGKEPFCRLTVGNKNEGLFAIFRWMLDGIYFCDRHGIIPIVSFSDNILYKDNEVPKELNPFDYYFECVSNNTDTKGRPEVVFSGRNGAYVEQLNNECFSYEYSKEYVEALAYAQKKYIRFNKETQQRVDEFVKKIGVNEVTLGIHIRGTDYRQNYVGHPIFVGPEEYFPIIDEALNTYSYKKVYLATDDSVILQTFISHYGSDLILYNKDNIRCSGNIGVHVSSHEDSTRKNYLLGMEVICDMVALSSCGGIISGMSQVALAARVYKRSKGQKYHIDHIISKGVNEKGKRFSV